MSQDQYFVGQEGVVQTFDFDYEKISEYRWEVAKNNFLCQAANPLCWPLVICAAPQFLLCGYDNLKDKVECQHVCVTQDGIRYVVDKHKTQCRFDCQDQGKVTKTVPFDKLTDCDIEEPAGAEGPICCMVDRVLETVNLDTASGDRSFSGHEMQLTGLVDSKGFKQLVWKMKRSGPSVAWSPQQQTMPAPQRQGVAPQPQVVGVAGTMDELAPLIRRTNELLEEIARNTAKSYGSAQ